MKREKIKLNDFYDVHSLATHLGFVSPYSALNTRRERATAINTIMHLFVRTIVYKR